MVDVVLKDSGIEEKFLGITLFALVPNTTEFMNAISFALNGNISLRYSLACLSPFTPDHSACDPSSQVLRLALPTPCRFVCSRFQPWLHSPLGMRPTKWARSQMHLRTYQNILLMVSVFNPFTLIFTQARIPALGCHRNHLVRLSDDLYLYRGQE
jgi:hypothetical protein